LGLGAISGIKENGLAGRMRLDPFDVAQGRRGSPQAEPRRMAGRAIDWFGGVLETGRLLSVSAGGIFEGVRPIEFGGRSRKGKRWSHIYGLNIPWRGGWFGRWLARGLGGA